jgi:hypothetical protein
VQCQGAKVELILSLREPSLWCREPPSERQGKILSCLCYPVIGINSTQGYFTAAMLYLDDILSRHDLLTVQALALTIMYSFRAEVSFVIKAKSGTGIDADI